MKKFISLLMVLAVVSSHATTYINANYTTTDNFDGSYAISDGSLLDNGTINSNKFDTATFVLISNKVDAASLATVAKTGSYNDLSDKPSIQAQSLSSAVLTTGFSANTVYTNDTGGTVSLQGFASYSFNLVAGSAYLTTQVASNSAAAFTTVTSTGSASLLTGLTPSRSDSFDLKIPRNWVGKVVTTISGSGNSITVNGTVLKTVTP